MAKKEKKIIFNEEVDNKIEGLALVLAFLTIGIYLLIFPSCFGNKLVAIVIRWIFISIGIIGLFVEFYEAKSSDIKGLDDFIIGVIIVVPFTVLFVSTNILWIHIISFLILIIGIYGLYLGSIRIMYSIFQNVRNHKETKKNNPIDIGLLLTKILGLVLVILQLIKVLGTK